MSNVAARITRLEVEQTELATKALAYIARVYGLTASDLDWLRETKHAIEAGIEGVWWEIVNDAIDSGGIEIYEAADGSMLAREIEPS